MLYLLVVNEKHIKGITKENQTRINKDFEGLLHEGYKKVWQFWRNVSSESSIFWVF